MLFLSIGLLALGYFFLWIGIKGKTPYVHAPWLLLVDDFKSLSPTNGPATSTAKPSNSKTGKNSPTGKAPL